jgi:hypothetical protein
MPRKYCEIPVKCLILAVFLFLITLQISTQLYAYTLPDTGQNKCYDNTQEIPCPTSGEAFYGQDAQYQSPQPAYTDNGDGTVTDVNTGLMWQKADDGTVTLGMQPTRIVMAYRLVITLTGGRQEWTSCKRS